MNSMDRLTPITPGELLDQEFLQPLGISQYRLAKAIDVPSAPTPICACAQAAHDKEVASTELAEEIARIQPLVGC